MDWNGRRVVVASISVAAGGSNAAAIGGHLGAHIALDFAARGADVLAIDGDLGALEALGAQAEGLSLRTVEVDLTDDAALAAVAERHAGAADGIEALINCHAEMEEGSLAVASPDSWRRIVAFNLLGPVFATRAFLPLLRRGDRAAVVHLGSIDGTLGNPNYQSYSASKGALTPLTHIMAHDLGRHGIRVNCAARAFFAGHDFAATEAHDEVLRLTPLGRPGRPEEAAALVRFLASPDAGYVTGAIVPIDGGRSGLTPATVA